jgi:hypothetical protein
MYILFTLGVGIVCAFACKSILENKGYTDTTLYFWLGFFFTIIGILIAALKPDLNAQPAQPVKTVTEADELKMYKELLDSGAITQDEFDQKKKQLLGL